MYKPKYQEEYEKEMDREYARAAARDAMESEKTERSRKGRQNWSSCRRLCLEFAYSLAIS